jgi:hypothetical protein
MSQVGKYGQQVDKTVPLARRLGHPRSPARGASGGGPRTSPPGDELWDVQDHRQSRRSAPSRWLQPLLAKPGNQPAPRRLASRVGPPEQGQAAVKSSGIWWPYEKRLNSGLLVAVNALKDCREVRRIIRQSFGLPVWLAGRCQAQDNATSFNVRATKFVKITDGLRSSPTLAALGLSHGHPDS